MEIPTLFEDLFQYNHHMNQLMARSLGDDAPEKALSLFSHILNAHEIWNSRIQRRPADCKVWDVRDAKTFAAADLRNFENTMHILQDDVPTREITYTTSKGETFRNLVRDVLVHIVNHSTYHRGQVNAELSRAGREPVITDYIFYKR